jgi:hypothetical protein
MVDEVDDVSRLPPAEDNPGAALVRLRWAKPGARQRASERVRAWWADLPMSRRHNAAVRGWWKQFTPEERSRIMQQRIFVRESRRQAALASEGAPAQAEKPPAVARCRVHGTKWAHHCHECHGAVACPGHREKGLELGCVQCVQRARDLGYL